MLFKRDVCGSTWENTELLTLKIDEKRHGDEKRRGRHEIRLFLAILFRGSPSLLQSAAKTARSTQFPVTVRVFTARLQGKAHICTHANRKIMRWNRSVF